MANYHVTSQKTHV
ncbi:hypothetical protein D030_1871A, partial [Vibrio parahaemolyticus AQ3810]